MKIVINGDGSCRGTPGPGGWAALIHSFPEGAEEQRLLATGGAASTTNQRMEVEAMIHALKWVWKYASRGDQVTLRFDSQYALKGTFEWLPGWKRNGWKNAAKAPVSNSDLWETVDRTLEAIRSKGVNLTPEWVKGHKGDPDNEAADKAAGEMSQLWKDRPEEAQARGVKLQPYVEKPKPEPGEKPAAKAPMVRKIKDEIKNGEPVLMVFAFEPSDESMIPYRGMPVVMRYEDGWRMPGPIAGDAFPDEAFAGWVKVAGIAMLPLESDLTPEDDTPEP